MATFFSAVLSSVPGLILGAIVGSLVGGPRKEQASSSPGSDDGGTTP
jgi:hypothetical protein